MYASTSAYCSVKKFYTIIVYFVLFLVTSVVIGTYESISTNVPEHLTKNVCEKGLDYIPGQPDYDSSSFMIITKPKSWFLRNGTRYPKPTTISLKTGIRNAKLLPHEDPGNDRIINQLMFVPPNYDSIVQSKKLKTILVYHIFIWWWNVRDPEHEFKKLKCPVDTCRLTTNESERQTADLVVYNGDWYWISIKKEQRPPKQLYAIYYMEPPHMQEELATKDAFNWTITYRMDSTIPVPYNKWIYTDPRIKQKEQNRNFAANKTKKVAWFVSNCNAANNRLSYAKELQKYIQVDIFGLCGEMGSGVHNDHYKRLDKEYKFYLAFENSNCKDYITEKFFRTGLGYDVIPIVMGAPPEDYEKYAPLRSYIHVEHFKYPKELAEYLHVLDKNDELYNSYFKWRGTGEFLGEFQANVLCRICALLHDEDAISNIQNYKDINEWFRGPGICTTGYWRDFDKNNSTKTPYVYPEEEV